MRTFVIDTSVLLADPHCLTKFDEHRVVLPIVVLDELESKRHHPELGAAARSVLRELERLRVAHGGLITPVAVNDVGGSLVIDLDDAGLAALPEPLRTASNDTRILAVAARLAGEGHEVTVVSKDTPLRLRASIAGLAADEYLNEQADPSGLTGLYRPATIDDGAVDKLYDAADSGVLVDDVLGDFEAPPNAGMILTGHTGRSALARLHPDGRLRVIGDKRLGAARGNSAEQRVAIELLDDPDLPLVSVAGVAGTGKTYLAIQAALASLDRGDHDRIVVLRSLQEVGGAQGERLGTLPGDESEKLAPATRAVGDALEAAVGPARARRMLEDGTVQVLPITHLRGRTITGTYLVVDESQQYEMRTLLSILSRAGGPGARGAGRPTKVVLTHDVAQRDNPYVGRRDGIAAAVARLTGHAEFGHVELTRVERSRVAELATSLLDDGR